MIDDGDELDIDARKGIMRNLTKDQTYEFTPLPDFALEIIEKGGLLKQISESK
jgi:3-isopropylmalate/(R)-2-methylmalate dehydratase small subunit